MKDTLKAIGVDEERVLRELRAIAFSRITDVMEGDAYTLKNLEEISDDAKAAIRQIKRQEGKTFKVDVAMYDKIKALGKLAEYLGMEQSSDAGGNLNIVVNTGIGRAPDGDEDCPVNDNDFETKSSDKTEGNEEVSEKSATDNDNGDWLI